MTKSELRRSLEKSGKDFLGLYEIAEVIGVNRGTVRQWMHGVSFIPVGRKKLYHINDITERLMQLKEK